ncbi:hypothetical protein ScalyP_jg1163 [Parmales sp. scaly parma]|nr:hypothetical protein ScalyP_jg1163 [Parmales sp. scaly parma]
MKLIRQQNMSPHEEETLSPSEIADFLLSKNAIHLEYSNIHTAELDGLDAFSNAREMYLQFNFIRSINEGLLYTTKLQLLTLHNNQITTLDGMFHLKRLQILDLANNQITSCGNYGEDTIPESLRILDLTGNPVTNQPNHRNLAASTLPNLTILDQVTVSEEDSHPQNDFENDNDNEISSLKKMKIWVDLEEDDGNSAQGTNVFFTIKSDLWAIADSFCSDHEIEGSLSRRQLVAMMKGEARERGVELVGEGGELTRRRMRETSELEEEEEEEEKEQEQKQKQENGTYDRLEDVRINSNRSIAAVTAFINEVAPSLEGNNFGEFKDRAMEDSKMRSNKDQEVSQGSLDEAKENLRRRIESIKKEKLEARRKAKESLAKADQNLEMRREMNEILLGFEEEKEKEEEEEEEEEEKGKHVVEQERNHNEDDDDYEESKCS